MVKLLLGQEGIEVNYPDKDGLTPLQAAANNGHEEAVMLLMRNEHIAVNQKNIAIKMSKENKHYLNIFLCATYSSASQSGASLLQHSNAVFCNLYMETHK